MKSHFRRRRGLMALASLALVLPILAAPQFASAQGSGQPMRVILPVSPGSGVDTIARAASAALAKALGQSVVIENMPGAGGITGTSAIVKARPDGATIGLVSNNHVINPSVYSKLPFDSIADITPISVMGSTPFVLVVNPRLPAKHVPYKGTGQMVTDLIGGQVELGVVALPAVQGHLKNGALRAIGVGGRTRTPAAPEIPTIAEQGLPNYECEGWFAVIGPAKLPASEVKRIHAAFVAAFAAPEVKENMAKQGNVINPTNPEQAAAYFRSETAKYAKLAQRAGIKLD